MNAMEVCIVSGESRACVGGLATYNRRLTEGLSSVGVRVSTVSRFDRDVPASIDYADGSNGVGRIVDGITTQLIGPSAAMRPVLRQLIRLNVRRTLRPLSVRLFNLAYFANLNNIVPRSVDVIHYIGTGWDLLGFTALSIARRRGARFTVLPAVHPGTWGDSPLDIDLYRRADTVFILSASEGHHLAGLGIPRPLLVPTPLAPASPPIGDARRFREVNRLGGRPVVLFIARKLRSKGFHATAAAMAAVLAVVPDACLVAIGPDGDQPYPQVPASAYLDLGKADDADKADALAACDVFCMPSTAESFGIVYVEAWSYGKPVVGGPAPAVRELIEDGVTGFTVKQQQPEAIAGGLIRLLTDPALRYRLGMAGRNLQESRYNWPAVVKLHRDVFCRIEDQS